MRPSKSLGNLLHHHTKSTAKLSGLQDTKYYPPDAEQYELLEEVGKGVRWVAYEQFCMCDDLRSCKRLSCSRCMSLEHGL